MTGLYCSHVAYTFGVATHFPRRHTKEGVNTGTNGSNICIIDLWRPTRRSRMLALLVIVLIFYWPRDARIHHLGGLLLRRRSPQSACHVADRKTAKTRRIFNKHGEIAVIDSKPAATVWSGVLSVPIIVIVIRRSFVCVVLYFRRTWSGSISSCNVYCMRA